MGEPITQFCGRCKTRKPIKGFNINRGLCAQCNSKSKSKSATKSTRAARATAQATGNRGKGSTATSPSSKRRTPKKSQCPNCLQLVPVDSSGTSLVKHVNGRRLACRGSGHRLPTKSQDALDYRVAGSFEGGSR